MVTIVEFQVFIYQKSKFKKPKMLDNFFKSMSNKSISQFLDVSETHSTLRKAALLEERSLDNVRVIEVVEFPVFYLKLNKKTTLYINQILLG